jgi:alpha-glucoside transport system permease protein
MTTFFNWLGTLNPILQAVVLVVAFGALVALALYLIDIAVKPGKLFTGIRLAVAVLVPAAILYLFNSYLWAVVVAAVIGAGLFLLDWRSRRGSGYLLQLIGFLLPAALLLLVGLIVPSIQTIGASFMNAAGNQFIGLDNFVWIFTQPQGLRTVLNTLLWVLIAPVVSTAIGLAYAVFIDKSRGEKFFKVLVFMPMAISAHRSSGVSSTRTAARSSSRSACSTRSWCGSAVNRSNGCSTPR